LDFINIDFFEELLGKSINADTQDLSVVVIEGDKMLLNFGV
jgi:hypothetical protein